MATSCSAWLLIPYGIQPFAVAEYEVIEYLNEVKPLNVPTTPSYCASVLFWRDHIIPFMELGALAGYWPEERARQAVVLAYQLAPATPLHYVAVELQAAPVRISVSDDMACDLPNRCKALWQRLAKACFFKDESQIPIISIKQLCSTEFCRAAERVNGNWSDGDDDNIQEDERLLHQGQTVEQKGKDAAATTWASIHDLASGDDVSSRLTRAQAGLEHTINILKALEVTSGEDGQMHGGDDIDLEDNQVDNESLTDDYPDMDDLNKTIDMFEEFDEIDTFDDVINDDLEDIELMALSADIDDIDELDDWPFEGDDNDLDNIDNVLTDLEGFDEDLEGFDEDLEGSGLFNLNNDITDAEGDEHNFGNLSVE